MKISVENSFITDDSNECEQGVYFVQTTANAKFVEHAAKNGAKIITLEECKKLLKIDENLKMRSFTFH